MVTMIPRDIQAEIISVVETSIIVATSLAVTNSVTLRVLLSISCISASTSICWRCWSLLSLRYLTPFPFFDLPLSFSSVSRTCFWTSASVGSTFGAPKRGAPFRAAAPAFAPLGPVPLCTGPLGAFEPGLALMILLRFRFSAFAAGLASSFFFFGFWNLERSIFSPIILGPESFLYCVSIFSSTGGAPSSGVATTGVSALTSLAGVGAIGSTEAATGSAAGFTGSTTSFSTFACVFTSASTIGTSFITSLTGATSSTGAISATTGAFGACGACFTAGAFSFFLGFKSILPTVLGPASWPLALMTSEAAALFSRANLLSSCSCSNWTRMASFSFRFSSPTSLDATFLLMSVWNSSNSTWCTSSEILVVGRASISWPFDAR